MTKQTTNIPIRNVYHMLSYVWDFPLSMHKKQLASEAFTNIQNLIGNLFANHVSTLVIRGLAKDYVEKVEVTQVLKGKVLFAEGYKQQYLHTKGMPCQFNELTENIVINQVVKATLYRLLQYSNLHPTIRDRLLLLRKYFVRIDDIDGSAVNFAKISLNRISRHYEILIHMAKLIFEVQNVSCQDGHYTFNLLQNDAPMHALYEKFLFQFYKKHLLRAKIYRPKITWQLSGTESAEHLKLLPDMQTDLVIEQAQIQLIIDAKFYRHTLSQNQFGQSKIRSGHLYQLLSYITNSRFTGEISGLLLFPKVDKSIDVNYLIQGHSITVKTIDLTKAWEELERDLLEVSARAFNTTVNQKIKMDD